MKNSNGKAGLRVSVVSILMNQQSSSNRDAGFPPSRE